MSATLAVPPHRSEAVPDVPRPVRALRSVRDVPLRGLVVDALVVLALAGLMAWEYAHARMDDGVRPADVDLAVSVPFSILAFAPIAVRRLLPLTAVLVAAGALLLPSLVVPVYVLFWSGFAPMIFLIYSLARHRRLVVAGPTAAGLVVLQAVTSALGGAPEPLDDVAFLATFAGLAVVLGVALRRSARQRQQLDDLLARLRSEQADRERLAVADDSKAQHCVIDRQGRLLLPDDFCRLAALDGEIMLAGAFSRFEIWNPARWERARVDEESEYQAIAEHIGL